MDAITTLSVQNAISETFSHAGRNTLLSFVCEFVTLSLGVLGINVFDERDGIFSNLSALISIVLIIVSAVVLPISTISYLVDYGFHNASGPYETTKVTQLIHDCTQYTCQIEDSSVIDVLEHVSGPKADKNEFKITAIGKHNGENYVYITSQTAHGMSVNAIPLIIFGKSGDIKLTGDQGSAVIKHDFENAQPV